MFLWYPVLDLARAPRRTARKKGSGYENDFTLSKGGFPVLARSFSQHCDWMKVLMHALAANCEELRARTGNPPLRQTILLVKRRAQALNG